MSGQFTDHPDRPSTVVFPHHTAQAVCFAIFLLAFATISGMITRRTLQVNIFSWKSWSKMSLTKILSIWIFIDSWLFLLFAGFLLYGVGMSTNSTACTAGVVACITFYFISKILISFFLLERVHIVNNHDGTPRRNSWTYKICLAAISLYVGYLFLATFGRVAELDEHRSCHIGLKLWVTVPMIVYDIFLNILLTTCFLYPIRSETQYNFALRRMAFRTVFASFAAFGSSTINIALVAAWNGHQQGWFCLLACSLDVLVNAFAIYWVTKPGEWSHNAEGFNTAVLIATRKSIDTRDQSATRVKSTAGPEVNIPPGQSGSTGSAGLGRQLRAMEDKDEYLRPMRDVYYPMGEVNFWYGEGEDSAVPPLSYDAEQGVPRPLRPPQPTLLQLPRRQSELMRTHTVSLNDLSKTPPAAAGSPQSDHTGSAAGDVVPEMGFADFLNEQEDGVRSPDGPVERRRISQEQAEGRMQKCFFDMVLGKSKAGAINVRPSKSA